MRLHLITPDLTAPAGRGAVGAPLGLALALALCACGPADKPDAVHAHALPQAPAKSAAAASYLAPPDLAGGQRTATGLLLLGHAPAGAQVNLASPEGAHLSANAGVDGRWFVTLPLSSRPAMFALSATLGARTLRSEGAVLTLPEPGPPVLLVRAGFAADPLGVPGPTPVVTALDYDRGGGAAVAGLARPLAQVRLSVDGVAAGRGQADEIGRFAVLAANRPLAPGRRLLQIDTAAGSAEVRVDVSQPAPLGLLVYRAVRQDGGWRIDWSPAGGGIQTTVVFDRAAALRNTP